MYGDISLKQDWNALETLLSDYRVATILCSNQSLKTRFISRMLSSSRPKNKVISYIDIDTMFTVFLEDHSNISYANHLYLFRPRGEDLDDVIKEICSLNTLIETVIFDSVTSFYNLQGQGVSSSSVNRKLGLYLALLKMTVSRSNGRILFTSMGRARKMKWGDSWYLSYAGGKLLRRRSDLILELNYGTTYSEVSILKCQGEYLNGASLKLDTEYI